MHPLTHTPDQFGGIIVDSDALPDEVETFRELLHVSLEQWRADGRRLVWLDVPIRLASLVATAVEAGFIFHHTGEDHLMLTCRLVDEAFIPGHATHYIGAGGVVVNDRDELLVVCERHRRTRQPYYKLPGGALLPGEHLVDAVVREVLEETGIQTRFESLVCFRHWHGYRYGKSDIYFVCRLAPLGEDLLMQESEIEECLWMPLVDYLASDLVSTFNKRIVRAALESPGVAIEVIEGYAEPSRYEFFMPRSVDG